MSKADKTKAFIIEKSAQVFNTKGYNGTALSDIIEVTGLTKGAIYGNFENKDEIAVEVFKYNAQQMRDRIEEELKGKNTAYEKLMAYMGYYRKNWGKIYERGGCPIQNASVEADDNLEVLKIHVQQSIINWAKHISDIIQEGIDKREFKPYINVPDYAFTIITIFNK